MRHATPPPLRMAHDLVKRFSLELGPKLTPEQRRDFSRLAKLLEDAERAFAMERAVQAQRAAFAPAGRGY